MVNHLCEAIEVTDLLMMVTGVVQHLGDCRPGQKQGPQPALIRAAHCQAQTCSREPALFSSSLPTLPLSPTRFRVRSAFGHCQPGTRIGLPAGCKKSCQTLTERLLYWHLLHVRLLFFLQQSSKRDVLVKERCVSLHVPIFAAS